MRAQVGTSVLRFSFLFSAVKIPQTNDQHDEIDEEEEEEEEEKSERLKK